MRPSARVSNSTAVLRNKQTFVLVSRIYGRSWKMSSGRQAHANVRPQGSGKADAGKRAGGARSGGREPGLGTTQVGEVGVSRIRRMRWPWGWTLPIRHRHSHL